MQDIPSNGKATLGVLSLFASVCIDEAHGVEGGLSGRKDAGIP